jgi:broad specificity phosphatase PhoE
MIIKLVRHGRSMGNEDPSTYITTPDHAIELTEEGKQQARDLATNPDMFKKEYLNGQIEYTMVYCSPFTRAIQTMNLFFEALGMGTHRSSRYLSIDHRIREQSWGKPRSVEEHDDLVAHHMNNRYYGKTAVSESGEMMIDRVHSFIDRIETRNKDCLIFTHGATINAFKAILKGYTIEQFENLGFVRNCSITTIKIN